MATSTITPPLRPVQTAGESASLMPKHGARSRPLFDGEILRRAFIGCFGKLNPLWLIKNPVIFVVEMGAAMVTAFLAADLWRGAPGIGFEIQIAIWLWFTVLFANFAEAMAEARGKAQADTLRKTKTDSIANRVGGNGKVEQVPASQLRSGDIVVCETGETIPGDGDVIDGIATVDESVITGESAPVIRESGGDRSAVTSEVEGAARPRAQRGGDRAAPWRSGPGVGADLRHDPGPRAPHRQRRRG